MFIEFLSLGCPVLAGGVKETEVCVHVCVPLVCGCVCVHMYVYTYICVYMCMCTRVYVCNTFMY